MAESRLLARIQRLSITTPVERKIAEYLITNHPKTAFESTGAIAAKLGISKVSVVNFVTKLGYRGYPELQQELQQDISRRLDSPFERSSVTRKIVGQDTAGLLAKTVEFQLESLQETHRRLSTDQFEEAVQTIVSMKGKLYVLGDRASYGLAHLFHTDLKIVFDRIHMLEGSPALIANDLIRVSNDDVLFCIHARRYSRTTTAVAKYFLKEGGRLILLTDSPMSPLASLATFTFVYSPMSFFDTSISALAVLEAFTVAIFLQRQSVLQRALAKAEGVWKELSVFDDIPVMATPPYHRRRLKGLNEYVAKRVPVERVKRRRI